ncbi:Uma2 family endonuclease [Streptomyces odonnellii]|uniref:Uma2 family endonuclease n=1 Tax=Streptomyces odonnellii TaxID=1417980 RepID=UPI0006262657|nr:Uma2 family endonuclease [Streptomyces odonnellii]
MTVIDNDRIAMANESDELILDRPALDTMFEMLEKMPLPEGEKVQIIGGRIRMSPQRRTHWKIIRCIVRAFEDTFGTDVEVMSDVRIDFPGYRNGFAPDVAKLAIDATEDADGRWHYKDVEFIGEVISKDSAARDYGEKKIAYATADVPVYLVINPYTGTCQVYTQPKDGGYAVEQTVAFGAEIDLTNTVLGMTLKTDKFPRD